MLAEALPNGQSHPSPTIPAVNIPAAQSSGFLAKLPDILDNLPIVTRVTSYWHTNPWGLVAEWSVIWLGTYIILHFLRGARGGRAVKLIATPLVFGALFFSLASGSEDGQFQEGISRLSLLYNNFLIVVGLVLLVAFQPELRRSIVRLGEMRLFHLGRGARNRLLDDVTAAAEYLGKNRIGAIIAIERDISMAPYLESGTPLDAVVSKELLSTVFWPGSMLHDLGLVIRGERVAAAGVQFPLADADLLPQELGSRHRAALGLSQEVDALIVVVSEETGSLSFAHKGQFKFNLSPAQLRGLLEQGLPAPLVLGFGKKNRQAPLAASGAPAPVLKDAR